MEMKIDPQRIRQLRESKAWSQEHLASLSSLSVRTIQRIETTGLASPESKLALAAAFERDVGDLEAPPAPIFATQAGKPRAGWKRHLLIYLLVCGSLLVFNLIRHGHVSWAIWPTLGWGIGLILHGLRPLLIKDHAT